LRQCQVEELERSHATLIEATKTLLETFQNRDRALTSAEERIKFLAERNAKLEAGANRTNGRDASDTLNIRQLTFDGADETSRKDWAELACKLRDFMERKRQSPGQAHVRSMTFLASTVTF
jgi:hypothetical protein